MKVETHWSGIPRFEDRYPDDWKRSENLLREIDLPYICYIGDEDVGSKVVLVMADGDERLDELVYTQDQFARISDKELTKDIFERAQRPIGNKRKLIQGVFDYFLSCHEWPLSRQMSVELRHLGNYYHLASEIGTSFISVGNEQDLEAVTTLTIYGMRLCTGSDEYLKTFLGILTFLCFRFTEMPEFPVVSSQELIDEGLISYGQKKTIYDMLWREGRFLDGRSIAEEDDFDVTVSHNILDYEKVQNIDDYIKIAYANRIKKQMKRETREVHDIDLIELSTEGVAVTRETKKTKFEFDLFISYSTRDSKAAKKIDTTATALGLKGFLAEKDLKGGDEWADRIRDALNSSREVVILVTPNSIGSIWVHRELTAAWVLYKRSTPILLNCTEKDLPDLLKPRHYVKFRNIEKFLRGVLERKNEP